MKPELLLLKILIITPLFQKTWFGITGIIIDKTTINGIAKDVMDLKRKILAKWEL